MKVDEFFKKILIGILIIIGALVLVLIILQVLSRVIYKLPPTVAPPRVLPTPTPKISLQKTKPMGEAVLSLKPASGNYRLGEIFTVAIQVDTQGKSATGVDVILNYDPKKLEVVEITPGTLFATYIRKENDEKKGKVYLSAAIFEKAEKPFIGEDTFGSIKFRSLSSGKTSLSFEYTPQATGDSNVTTEGGLDFLTKVIGGTYQIQ